MGTTTANPSCPKCLDAHVEPLDFNNLSRNFHYKCQVCHSVWTVVTPQGADRGETPATVVKKSSVLPLKSRTRRVIDWCA